MSERKVTPFLSVPTFNIPGSKCHEKVDIKRNVIC